MIEEKYSDRIRNIQKEENIQNEENQTKQRAL